MFRFIELLTICALLLVQGCATSGQTTLLGLGIGSLAGGTIGALVDAGPKDRLRGQNLFCGSSIGGLLGASGAYLLHPNDSKRAEIADMASQTNALMKPKQQAIDSADHPLVVPPQVETRYVDDQVKGNTFVPGHLEFQIVQPGQWNKE